ncbi:hypothetical protein FPSE5266_00675 [Fusarium pseudograminearum]|nr:hypothetical protein FPSE5266_00675 [Fusarium pseudograminearum]
MLNTLGYRLRDAANNDEDLGKASECFLEALQNENAPTITRVRAGSALLQCCPDKQKAYQAAQVIMGLLPQLITRSHETSDKQHTAGSRAGMTCSAAAAALQADSPLFEALQVLELGRGVLAKYSEEMLFDPVKLGLLSPEQAKAYSQLRDELQVSNTFSQELSLQGHISQMNKRHSAATELEELIVEIRKLPGFEDLWTAPTEAEIFEAAKCGSVVVINISDGRCDAIIITKDQMRSLALCNITNDLHQFARKGDFVSSYASSIRAINRGRQNEISTRSTSTIVPRAMLVGMQYTPECGPLPFANKEVDIVQELCKSLGLETVRPSPRKEDVSKGLLDCKVFHFAGHGCTDEEDPSNSHLLLEGWKEDRLCVADLQRMNLREHAPFLAYLSACGTGQMKRYNLVDESIHLISAYQLAGFRHVIGTLWKQQQQRDPLELLVIFGVISSTSLPLSSSPEPAEMFAHLRPGLGESSHSEPNMFSHLHSNTAGTVPANNESHPHLQLLNNELPKTKLSGSVPIFTAEVLEAIPEDERPSQFGLLALDIAPEPSHLLDPTAKMRARIFYNVADPTSTFICGSQGSGKSHTLSTILENCLLPCPANQLPRPLCGLVFHYDTFISDTGGMPCEAAYLSSHAGVNVRVLCAPSNYWNIKRIYSGLPNVAVQMLRINQSDLNTQRMLDLMAVSSVKGGGLPLYLHVVSRILRDMRIKQQTNGTAFDYATFKALVNREDLKEGQMVPLQQRLETLESFMVPGQTAASKFRTAGQGINWTLKAGQLTIVDLSCPCVTAEAACSLFNICLSLYLEQKSTVGRIVALDEAHKYMTESCDSQTLTESLLSVIRLQRHLGTRVILSTQEPTISPKLLDLCSTVIVHRFTSPAWFSVLQKHLAGVDSHVFDLMAHIVELKTGEALLFCPSALASVSERHVSGQVIFRRLANSRLKVRVRQRVTADGGKSIMAN